METSLPVSSMGLSGPHVPVGWITGLTQQLSLYARPTSEMPEVHSWYSNQVTEGGNIQIQHLTTRLHGGCLSLKH